MWFINLYSFSSILTIFPLMLTFFMITTDWGAKIFKLIVALTILSFFFFVIFLVFGQFSLAFLMGGYVIAFYIWWAFGTVMGAILWALPIIFIETILFVIRTIIPQFKFSLFSLIFK